jgi:hypothetical protein
VKTCPLIHSINVNADINDIHPDKSSIRFIFDSKNIPEAGMNDRAKGKPATAKGRAHRYSFPSTRRAFPIHLRLERKYPKKKHQHIKNICLEEDDLHSK